VRGVYQRDVLASEAIDLTHLAGAAPEREVSPPVGVTLTPQVDSEDELTKDLGAPLAGLVVGEPVQVVADLPTTVELIWDTFLQGYVPGYEDQAVRLVLSEDAWYQAHIVWDAGFESLVRVWTLYAPNYPGIALNGDGEAVPMGPAVTRMKQVATELVAPAMPWLPAVHQAPFVAGGEQARSTSLRLAFYRGLQPAVDGTIYPLVTPGNVDVVGRRLGQYSLALTGADGLYEQWLKGWMKLKYAPAVVKDTLALDAVALHQLELSRLVRLRGVDYLVRKAAPSLPLRKPTAVELVKV
jgi:hypothetical protein